MSLLPHHRALLDASAIAPEVAEARGYRSVTDASELPAFGFPPGQVRGLAPCLPGLLVPIHDAEGRLALHQLRPDREYRNGTGKPAKYVTPKGRQLVLDVPKALGDGFRDAARPLWITEGARKVDAAVSHGLCCLGLLGVDGWGSARTGPRRDWDHVRLDGREVFVAFDSDAMTKATVAGARARLTRFLAGRGARVRWVVLPSGPEGAKTGLDDFLASGGTVAEALALAREPRPEELGLGLPLTDLGNARRFALQHADAVRYCPSRGWLVWDGRRWADDRDGAVMRLAKATARRLGDEAQAAADDETRAKLFKWAATSQSVARLLAMLKLAESEAELVVTADRLDRDPWRLTVLNGTLDLETGQLYPHDPADLGTMLAPVAYDPAATAPTFDRFLATILPDPATRAWLQRWVGYSLTGDTSEHAICIGLGAGANGKSTLVELVRVMLGDYAAVTSFDSFLDHGNGSAVVNHDLARLPGKRLVTATESADGRRLAEGRLKAMTGGDVVVARRLYREAEEFLPAWKVWLVSNHRPEVHGQDEGLWRRLRLLPFPETVPEADRDRQLPERLRAELPGVLAWAVAGCLAWQAEGLGWSDTVRAATAAYRTESDVIGAFLEEVADTSDPRAETPAGTLYARFQSWCEGNGERRPSQTTFGRQLAERGIARRKTGGLVVWVGVRLRGGDDAAPF